MKYPVTLAVTVSSYCTIEVEAKSQAAADEKVAKSIESKQWGSPYWRTANDWDTDWNNADNLRVLGFD
jgi:hypothetical protein